MTRPKLTILAEAADIASRLGVAQKRTVLSLGKDWGPADSHAAAKRLWWRNDIPQLLDHKHCTDNCWALRPVGVEVRDYLAAQGGEARQGGDACGSVHEHPVAEGHAPNSCPSHPINTQGDSL